jgi:hypothetical protein
MFVEAVLHSILPLNVPKSFMLDTSAVAYLRFKVKVNRLITAFSLWEVL